MDTSRFNPNNVPEPEGALVTLAETREGRLFGSVERRWLDEGGFLLEFDGRVASLEEAPSVPEGVVVEARVYGDLTLPLEGRALALLSRAHRVRFSGCSAAFICECLSRWQALCVELQGSEVPDGEAVGRPLHSASFGRCAPPPVGTRRLDTTSVSVYLPCDARCFERTLAGARTLFVYASGTFGCPLPEDLRLAVLSALGLHQLILHNITLGWLDLAALLSCGAWGVHFQGCRMRSEGEAPLALPTALAVTDLKMDLAMDPAQVESVLASCPRLRTASLSTELTPVVMTALARIESLQWLDVSGCWRLSLGDARVAAVRWLGHGRDQARAKRRLAQAFPNAELWCVD